MLKGPKTQKQNNTRQNLKQIASMVRERGGEGGGVGLNHFYS